MTTLADTFPDDFNDKLFKSALTLGDVFLAEFEGIPHPKFFIVVGLSNNKVFTCTVFINSKIHPSIMARQELLDLQVYVKKKNNKFLKYDSFVDCSTANEILAANIKTWKDARTCKVIGSLFDEDLTNIISTVINSGLLTPLQIEKYF